MLGVTKKSPEYGDVGLVERPEATARPGTAVLRVAAAGICGTDLHIFKNEYAVASPVVMGHEVCGIVEQVGNDADTALIGRRFVAETFFHTCGNCHHCRVGRPNLCAHRKSIGSHVDGAMASLVEVPVRNLHAVPEGISDAAASLAEPVACVANSLFGQAPYVEPGDLVLVIGPGAIGLVAAQVARMLGAEVTVRGTDKDRDRLTLASDLGFATSIAGDDLGTDQFDVVVECSGSPFGYADALRYLGKTGHLAQMGLAGRASELNMDQVCYKELTITSGFASTPRSWQRAMRLIRSGQLDLESLVTARLPLSAWKEGFDRSFASQGVKYVIDPRMDNGGSA